MLALDLRQLEGSAAGSRRLAAAIALGGLTYGAVMGAYGGVLSQGALQMLFSAVKVPMLLLVTFAITLPSFFVLNTLLGLRSDFGQVLRALLITQAVLAVVLASFAPYTALWYASSGDYDAAQLFNLAMFAAASLVAQAVLRRLYRPLIARSPKHRLLLGAWLGVYAFVAVQMAWVLRPFIGAPGVPTRFFREDAWSNAYIVVARLLWRTISGQ